MRPIQLLHPEGLAVGALVLSGVSLVGANQDAIQGAVICIRAVVSALLYGAFNALVSLTIHCQFLLFSDRLSMKHFFFSIRVFLIDI